MEYWERGVQAGIEYWQRDCPPDPPCSSRPASHTRVDPTPAAPKEDLYARFLREENGDRRRADLRMRRCIDRVMGRF